MDVAASFQDASTASQANGVLQRTSGENGAIEDVDNKSPSPPPKMSSASQPSVVRSAGNAQAWSTLDGSDMLSSLDSHDVDLQLVDPQFVEDLKSGDPRFILELGEKMETLIKERQ